MTFEFDPHPGKFKTWEEACTYAYRQVVKQGRRSAFQVIDSTCAYRGAEGSKCFVGHLIPDSQYTRFMEYLPAHKGVIFDVLVSCVEERPFPSLKMTIGTFQAAHDEASYSGFIQEFKQTADAVFKNRGWSIPVI